MIDMDRAGYLARHRNGQITPRSDKLVDIADGFGITLSELFEGVDDQASQES